MKSTTEKLIAHKKDHHLSVRHKLFNTCIVCDDCGNVWSSSWDRPFDVLTHLLASVLIVILICTGLLDFWWSIENDVLSFLLFVITALPFYFLVRILCNALHGFLLCRSKDLSKQLDKLL